MTCFVTRPDELIDVVSKLPEALFALLEPCQREMLLSDVTDDADQALGVALLEIHAARGLHPPELTGASSDNTVLRRIASIPGWIQGHVNCILGGFAICRMHTFDERGIRNYFI